MLLRVILFIKLLWTFFLISWRLFHLVSLQTHDSISCTIPSRSVMTLLNDMFCGKNYGGEGTLDIKRWAERCLVSENLSKDCLLRIACALTGPVLGPKGLRLFLRASSAHSQTQSLYLYADSLNTRVSTELVLLNLINLSLEVILVCFFYL